MNPLFPAIPIAMEEDTEHVLVSSDGVIKEHFNLIYTPEDTDRIRLGYCCINCGESVVGHGKGEPFPEECAICHYPMRAKQMGRFGLEFMGNVRVGPGTSTDEELAIAEEMVERQELASQGLKRTDSIVVPSWART